MQVMHIDFSLNRIVSNLEFLEHSYYKLKNFKKFGVLSPLCVFSNSCLNGICPTLLNVVNTGIRFSSLESCIGDCLPARINQPINGQPKATRLAFYVMNNVA